LSAGFNPPSINIMSLLGRFQSGSEIFWGVVSGETVVRLEEPPRRKLRPYSLKSLKVLVPVTPRKLFAVGLNYSDHVLEMGRTPPTEPVFWLKAPSSLLPHKGTVRLANPKNRTDHEVELAIVIGRRGTNISEARASRHILGYTLAQDISDRHVQKQDGQWMRAKSFDTYTPLGPFIDTGFRPGTQRIETKLNGKIRQHSTLDQLTFKPARLVSFISRNLTLEPGDIILTGTPAGVSPLKKGDVIESTIEGLGTLMNRVA
jgi:2-keto-4-pentenoate hydratase/2-oxohepta-3-ene-1,7-dioic acid hydratase in catechol pathway